jgi:hypothetical protein
MEKGKLWLQICYWVGAVFDGATVIPMLFPQAASMVFGISPHPETSYRVAMAMATPLMMGWTVLLIWAARQPWERRGILLITLFPVLIGLILACIYAVETGFISKERMIPTWIFQGGLFLLFSLSYARASVLSKKGDI